MMSLFKERQDSKDIAKRRLKSLISNEKNNINTENLDLIKSEILNCVEDYLPINRMNSHIYISDEDKKSNIVVVIPIDRGDVRR